MISDESDRFNPRDPRSLMLRFHTQTAGSSLTAQQPEVNVVRTTIQALALRTADQIIRERGNLNVAD